MIFKKPSIILIRPQLPENIGMVARAMDNFGLKDLIIVSPREKWPNKEALNSSKHASLIIEKTKVFTNLEKAISNFNLVIATTNRKRYLEKESISDFQKFYKLFSRKSKIGIMFGPENSGLSNNDIRLADYIFTIPTNYRNSSLNLSHAVSIIAFKLKEYFDLKTIKKNSSINSNLLNYSIRAKKSDLSNFIQYLIKNLEDENFFISKEKKDIMINNIYAIFLKAGLSKKEINTLWGIFKKLRK